MRLTAMQEAFAREIVNGSDTVAAATKCGYADPVGDAWRAMRTPAVVSAIQFLLAQELCGRLAPLAFKFCRQVLEDENGDRFSPRIRADVAKTVIDRAGFTPPKQSVAQSPEDKAPEEMTESELRETCARLEAELAGRARDVTPVDSPDDADLADLL